MSYLLHKHSTNKLIFLSGQIPCRPILLHTRLFAQCISKGERTHSGSKRDSNDWPSHIIFFLCYEIGYHCAAWSYADSAPCQLELPSMLLLGIHYPMPQANKSDNPHFWHNPSCRWRIWDIGAATIAISSIVCMNIMQKNSSTLWAVQVPGKEAFHAFWMGLHCKRFAKNYTGMSVILVPYWLLLGGSYTIPRNQHVA